MKKLFLLCCLVLLGFGLWIDNSLLLPASSRKIASTQDEPSGSPKLAHLADLSGVRGAEFKKAFKYALIQSAHALADETQIGFSFGNFLVAGANGQKVFACNQYTYIELNFIADGIAFSGDAPQLLVRGICETASENIFIEALRIPYREILALPSSQAEFVPQATDAHQRIKIKFKNTADQWPRQWNLVGVKLYNDQGESLSLDGYEIISILGQPLTMEWGD